MKPRAAWFVGFLVPILAAMLARAEVPGSTLELFPDTATNRGLVAEAFEQYLEMDQNYGHFIEVNEISMHYLEWGDKGDPPLIWSHGYSSTGFELINVGQKLADTGYHVFAITYRGHGQTQVNDYNFSLADIADDIAAMMDQLGIEKAVIGGLSLGGGVATTFYENYPERVLALALEDGGGDAVQARIEKRYSQMKALMANMPEFPTHFENRFAGFQYLVSWYMPGWGGAIPEGAVPIFHSWMIPGEEGGVNFHIDDTKLWGDPMAAIDPGQGYKLTLLAQSWRRVHPLITYRNLSVPLLIIDPVGDWIDHSESFEELRVRHEDWIKVVEYPDTPHFAHPMRPDWFIRDMKELLQRVNALE